MKKILVAVAWPYVNGDIHVGHLAGYLLPADIMARFQRLVGNDVLMVSGSDSHGTPITVEADKQRVTAGEIVEKYHKRDVALFNKLGLSYNLYTTTTTANHKRVVQDLFIDLLTNGFISKKTEKQYFSPTDNKFLPDRYVEGECPHCHSKEQRSDQCEVCGRMLEQGTLINPYSKLTKSEVILKDTEHYYLDLAGLSGELEKYVDSKKDIWKNWIYQEAKGWIKEGLLPRAITRDLDWGVEIPIDRIPDDQKLDRFEGKKIYVWFEAVTGYLSAPQEWSQLATELKEGKMHDPQKNQIVDQKIFNIFNGQSTDWEEWWNSPNAYHYYFLGQDNVVFHTILWQGQLIGAKKDYHLPDNVAANKFMNYEGKKFSKSRGHIIDSDEIISEFGVDPVRYYIAANLPENKEGDFTWASFIDAINNELVANLGNLVNRSLVFLHKSFDGEISGSENLLEKEIIDSIKEVFEKTSRLIDEAKMVEALGEIMKLSSLGNKYFNDSEIWHVIKDDPEKAKKIMFNLLQIVSGLSVLISPFLPETSDKLRKMLGLEILTSEVGKDQWKFQVNETIKITGEVKPLFNKIDKEKTLEIKNPKEDKTLTPERIKELVSKIKVAKILEINKHPDADKLLVTKVSDGVGEYQVVTGADNIKVGDLVPYLGPDNIVPGILISEGKEFVLKTKPLRGIESAGMILAEDEIGLSDKHEEIYVLNVEEELLGRSLIETLTDEQVETIIKGSK